MKSVKNWIYFSWWSRSALFLVMGLALLLFLFSPAASWASPPMQDGPNALRLTLEDLGFTSDMVLTGSRVEATFAFPLPEGGITGGELNLKLNPSPLLIEGSTVQVFLNDQPAESVTITALEEENFELKVPVEAVDRPFLTVRVVGNLTIHENQCLDENSYNLWLTIAKESSLTYTYAGGLDSIRAFLRLPGGQVVLHGNWDSPENQAASISLFSTLKYIYRNSPTEVVLAESDAVSNEEGLMGRDVFVADNSGPPIERKADGLYVAPTHDALHELVVLVGQPLLLGQTVSSLDIVPTPKDKSEMEEKRADGQLNFDELGFGNRERVGIGDLPISYRFTLAEFGGWPNDLYLHLHSVVDPISAETLERAYLRVDLNGTAIESFDLRDVSILKEDIELPQHLLQVENFLNLTFVYAPESGNCLGSPYAFKGQILKTSAFSWDGYDQMRGILPEFISQSGNGALYLRDASATAAQATALLIGSLNQYTTDPLLPQLADFSTRDEGDQPAYRIVVGAEGLRLPVNLGEPFEVLNTEEEASTPILSGTQDEPLVAVQYFVDLPTLVVHTNPSASDNLLNNMIERISDPQEFFLLNGNVVIASENEIVTLDLSNQNLEVSTPEARDWFFWLMRYRWVLMIVMATLLVLIWWSVYTRLGRRIPA